MIAYSDHDDDHYGIDEGGVRVVMYRCSAFVVVRLPRVKHMRVRRGHVDQDGQSQVCSSEAPSITYEGVVLMVIAMMMVSNSWKGYTLSIYMIIATEYVCIILYSSSMHAFIHSKDDVPVDRAWIAG